MNRVISDQSWEAAGNDPFGSDLGLVHEVIINMRKRHMGRCFWKLLQEDQAALDRAIEGALNFPTFECHHQYTFNEKDIPQLVALGEYDEKNLPSGVPRPCEGAWSPQPIKEPTKVSLYVLPRLATVSNVTAQLEGLQYRPARLIETLLLGVCHRELQLKQQIVCIQRTLEGDGGRGCDTLIQLHGNGNNRVITSLGFRTYLKYGTEGLPKGTAIPCVRL